MIYIATILFLLVFSAKVYINYKQWKKRIIIKHAKQILIAAVACIPIAILFAKHSVFIFWVALPLTILDMVSFWVGAFDPTYNLVRRQLPFSTGSEDGKADAWWDNALQSIKPIKIWKITISKTFQQAAIRVIALVFSIWLYTKLI